MYVSDAVQPRRDCDLRDLVDTRRTSANPRQEVVIQLKENMGENFWSSRPFSQVAVLLLCLARLCGMTGQSLCNAAPCHAAAAASG